MVAEVIVGAVLTIIALAGGVSFAVHLQRRERRQRQREAELDRHAAGERDAGAPPA